MMDMLYKLKRKRFLLAAGLISLLGLVTLLITFGHSLFVGITDFLMPASKAIDSRYQSVINGIDTPKEMQRQYARHPAEYKFALDDDLVVLFAYPDERIRWMGMVFIHHIPSLSEVALDFDGNEIYEQVTSPEVQVRFDAYLNDSAFIEELQNRMSQIWALGDPGDEVLSFVEALRSTGNPIEFLGGRPQTLFEASMFLVRIDGKDINLYEFPDEAARRSVSDHISADGYEFTQSEGKNSIVIHIEYLEKPNFWAKDNLLVQYLGTDQAILELLTTHLGVPITTHGQSGRGSAAFVSRWQTYTNSYFNVSLRFPAHWQQVDGEARYGERFAGEDGYFTITAMGDVGITLDQAVQAEVGHKLQPYGPDPRVEEFQVQDQEARLIVPSAHETENQPFQSALLVLYPQPVSIVTGGGEHVYPIFVLYADPAHIRALAESLQFEDVVIEH